MAVNYNSEWAEQASAPANPATGNWKVYFKSDGLYVLEDDGTEHGPFAEAAGAYLPIPASIVTVATGRDIATTDAGKILEVTATAALNCPNAIGSNLQCAVVSIGGTTTITATTTLQYLSGGVQTAASGVTVNTQCTLYHRGSNVWLVMGDVTAI